MPMFVVLVKKFFGGFAEARALAKAYHLHTNALAHARGLLHLVMSDLTVQTPRKANECFIDNRQFRAARPLFDEFWREGELALMFGAAGTGKSVLAVQIAEAISRGKALDGFRMPTGRTRVLYVDLILRDSQFQARYTSSGSHAKSYKFADRLYRDRPPADADLVDWLRATATANGFTVVVIDDLSAVKNTHDGTLETLRLMRRLRQLRDELNISILVLTDSDEPGRSGIVSATDLGRSRVLCGVADSVFAIGSRMSKDHDRYIIQTRSRSASMFWTEKNAPVARVERSDTGMIGFVFDDRFAAEMDEETRQLIRRVRSMHDAGMTFRMIAETLGISKTRVHRLNKKWTPAMEPKKPDARPVPEFYGLDRCIYTGCMDCPMCGGRPGNHRIAAGSNIDGHKNCPDDCDLCGPRRYSPHDRSVDPKLKELSDKFYAELRTWLLAGKLGQRPQYPGAKRFGVKDACRYPGSEDWNEAELKEYTHWRVKGRWDHQAAALALRGRIPSSPPAGGGVAIASTDGVVGASQNSGSARSHCGEAVPLRGLHTFSEDVEPPIKSVVALRSPRRDQGSGRDVETLPARQASPQCDAAEPPAPSSLPGLRRVAGSSSPPAGGGVAVASTDGVVGGGTGITDDPKPRSIFDLKRGLDGHGDEIFIQTECKTTGKPTVWYKLDRHKNITRYERTTTGITATHLGKTEMLC